ncbi:acyltransferase [Williamsia maris]|uniref:Maltose O-acetyltransferase n=1 Tax=Williamsia maris TaxID=72806 RepID=A0ABT1HIR1_9NOCA|nr:DapH/DapD/GlmU-related protein [Williamsia maris]MCP2177833.1 maltose O-acetyltransferase [Williamsia maris]
MNFGKIIDLARQELGFLFRDVVINTVISSTLVPRTLRATLVRLVGHRGVSSRALISPGVFLGARTGLTMEPGTIINYGSFLDLGAPVTMAENAGVGYEVMLITCSHEMGPSHRRYGVADNRPIVIGAGAWVGSRATILPGVTVGAGCVIGVGSVVTADCVDNGVYMGTPARLIRILDDAEPRSELSANA